MWNLSVLNQLPPDIREELLNQVPPTTKNKLESLKMLEPASLMKSSTNRNNLKSPEKKKKEKSPANKNNDKNSIGKSRRGRPRKIDQLFDSSKYRDMKVSSLTNSYEKKLLFSPSNVDINTLNELPEEIRNEIVAEMKSVKIVSKKKDFKPTNQVQSENKNNLFAETKLNQVSFVPFQKPEVSTPLQMPAISAPFQKPDFSLSLQKNVDDTGDAGDILFLPSQLNESFMKALPEDIQNELLQSIERKNEARSDVLKQKEKESPTLTIKDIGASTPIPSIVPSLVVSSDKRVTNCLGANSNSFDILSPSQLDLSVFNELPVELQREVMMVARSNKNRNIRNKEKQRFLTNIDQITAKKEIPLQVKLTQVF